MPVYSVSRAHLHDEILKIEARGEIVVWVVPDGAALIVLTAARHTGVETR